MPAIYGIAGIELMKASPRDSERVARSTSVIAGRQAGRHSSHAAGGRGALIGVRSTDAPRLVSELAADGSVTSERDNNLRISAHAYNNEDDIEAVVAALASRRHLLA